MTDRNEHNSSTTDEVGEHRLRKTLLDQAPQGSIAHDRNILAAANAAAEKTRQTNRGSSRSWLKIAAGLAASVLVVLSVWQLSIPTSVDPDTTVRGTDNSEVTPADNATLVSVPEAFRWEAQPGVRRYQLSLRNDSAELLWTSVWVDKPEVSLPAEVSNALSHGARYFWVVEIDGNAARQSLGPYWFRIAD